MRKFFSRLLAVGAFLAACVLAVYIGTLIREAIYQAQYFSDLPAYEEELVEPVDDTCPLCEGLGVNTPCVVNLNTGVVGEITLYDMEDINSKHIDKNKTSYGVMYSGFAGAGVSYHSFPDHHNVSIGVERKAQKLYDEERAQVFFCDDCMEKIRALEPNCCYVFADCYDRSNITLHKLEDAEDGITIRHYTIKIRSKGEKYCYLDMDSSFFTGGSELDY